MKPHLFFIALFSLGLTTVTLLAASEEDYYRIITLPIPEGLVLEAGALQWMPDGKLAVSTRYGDVYMVERMGMDPTREFQFVFDDSDDTQPWTLTPP